MNQHSRKLNIFLLIIFIRLVSFSHNSYSSQKELFLCQHNKEIILKYTKALINGENITNFEFPEDLNKIKNSVIITLFSKEGELLMSERIDNRDLSLKEKFKRAVENIKNKLKLANQKYKNSYIHIMIVSYTAKFANFGIKGLFDWKVYEPRVTGIIYKLKDKKAELNPLQCLAWDFDSRETRAYLARKLKINPRDMIKHNDLKIEIYRVIHFGESYPDRKFTNYFRGHRLFTINQVDNNSILNSLKWIAYWYKHNVRDGEVNYLYDPTTGLYNNSARTMVRSTMAVWVLNKLAYFLNDEELKKLGKKCIDYYLERYFNIRRSLELNRLLPSTIPTQKGEIASNRYTTASFLAMAILTRDDADKYKKEVKLLMDWVMKYQGKDGFFWTQYAQSQYFMPGQLLLAVATLYEKTKDKYYKKYFDLSFDAYSKCLENMMYLGEKWYAPLAPAWFTMPFTKMYEITKEEKYRDIIYKINDRVLTWYDRNTKYKSYFDYDGILAPKPGYYGNVSITSAALESLVDACYTAKLAGDKKREEKYKNVIKHAVAYLIRLQYLPENTYYIRNRERVLGGFKYDLVHNEIWMDNIWHLTDALMKILRYNIL